MIPAKGQTWQARKSGLRYIILSAGDKEVRMRDFAGNKRTVKRQSFTKSYRPYEADKPPFTFHPDRAERNLELLAAGAVETLLTTPAIRKRAIANGVSLSPSRPSTTSSSGNWTTSPQPVARTPSSRQSNTAKPSRSLTPWLTLGAVILLAALIGLWVAS